MAVPCDICFELYSADYIQRKPRLLPRCGHDFCTKCVRNLCKSAEPKCPICRERVFADHSSRPTEAAERQVEKCPEVRCLLELQERIEVSSFLKTVPLDALRSEIASRNPPDHVTTHGSFAIGGGALPKCLVPPDGSDDRRRAAQQLAARGARREAPSGSVRSVAGRVSSSSTSVRRQGTGRLQPFCPPVKTTLIAAVRSFLVQNGERLFTTLPRVNHDQRMQLLLLVQGLPLLGLALYFYASARVQVRSDHV